MFILQCDWNTKSKLCKLFELLGAGRGGGVENFGVKSYLLIARDREMVIL